MGSFLQTGLLKEKKLSGEDVGIPEIAANPAGNPASSPNSATSTVGSENRSSLDFKLVGKGEKGVGCGDIVPVLSCMICSKTHFVKSSCKQKSCPDCWKTWLNKTTQRIVFRLIYSDNRKMRLMHVVVSPGPEIVKKFVENKITFTDLKMCAVKYLHKKSILLPAGCLIFHPFRPNKQYYAERKEERESEDENINKEQKKWDWIRAKANWWDYVDFSPHFHFIGYVGWLEKPVKGEDCVYKLIRTKKGYKGMRDKKDIFKVVHYLLSHTGSSTSPKLHNHTYVWLGRLSYRNGKPQPDSPTRRKKNKCKLCGGPLFIFKKHMNTFFKAWLNINLKRLSYKEAKRMVLCESKIPYYIANNVLEALDVLETGKPPPNYKKFLIK